MNTPSPEQSRESSSLAAIAPSLRARFIDPVINRFSTIAKDGQQGSARIGLALALAVAGLVGGGVSFVGPDAISQALSNLNSAKSGKSVDPSRGNKSTENAAGNTRTFLPIAPDRMTLSAQSTAATPTPESPTPTPFVIPTPESGAIVAWPPETARILSMMSTPDGLRLVSAPSAPTNEPTCSGSCYRSETREVWFVGVPTSSQKGILAHEVGHAHQNWQTIQEGLPFIVYPTSPSTSTWENTRHGQEFKAAFNAFKARMKRQGQSVPYDIGYHENFAVFISDWYDPVNTWASIILNDPDLKAFGDKWHPKPVSAVRTVEESLNIRR